MEKLELKNGWIYYGKDFISPENKELLFQQLIQETPWSGGEIKIFGKSYEIPRKQAYMADVGQHYSYSGKSLNLLEWSPTVLALKQKIEVFCDADFNACLLNLYQDGSDSNGWHADNERELGRNPTIASLSFGETRFFDIQHIHTKQKLRFPLESGSLLIMGGEMQHFWKHQIPKQKKINQPRVNLTFRKIVS
jgi:alkylated DNA repair dioxygenase AlkB